MTKVAVVTGYFLIDFEELDLLPNNFTKIDNFDYYLFTNVKSKLTHLSEFWNIIEVDTTNVTHGVYITKRVKWLTHEYLPDYDIIIWVDSFIIPNHLKINT